MKTLKEKIKVMQAFDKGERIQCCKYNSSKWNNISKPDFNWEKYDFRVVKKPGIDWTKVAPDTPVLVRDTESEEWRKAYFAYIDEDGVLCSYYEGTTSETSNGLIECWMFMKLDTKRKSLINWVKNTGDFYPCKKYLYKFDDGSIYSNDSSYYHSDRVITHYAIIE